MPKLSDEEFLSLLESKANSEIVQGFVEFRKSIKAKYDESRLRFELRDTQLSVQLKPPRATPKKTTEWIDLISFKVKGDHKHRIIGVCIIMKRTEIDLRKYGYPAFVATTFYDDLETIDYRLKVGTPLDQGWRTKFMLI